MSAPQVLLPDCFANMAWRPFYNNAGETIPAFAVMEQRTDSSATGKSGGAPADQGYTLETLRKPLLAACGPMATFWVNSQLAVPYSVAGTLLAQGFCSSLINNAGLVAYDNASGTPVPGQVWGPKNGSWLLTKDYPGFLIVSTPGTVNGIRVVQAMQQLQPIQGFYQTEFSGLTGVVGDYVAGNSVSDAAGIPGNYTDTSGGVKMAIAGRYEYDFHGAVTSSSYGAINATVSYDAITLRAYKVASGGTTTALYSYATGRPLQISGVPFPGFARLRGFVNLDHYDVVKIKIEGAGGTVTFNEGILTVKYMGPQLTTSSAITQ